MKERFFTVLALIVFIAFAVFPMTLEADPGSDENQHKIYNFTNEADSFKISRLRKPICISLTNTGCKGETSCDSESYIVPEGYKLIVRYISIRATLSISNESYEDRPYAEMIIMPDPAGPCRPVSPVIGTLNFNGRFDTTYKQNITLSERVEFFAEQNSKIHVNVQASPNTFAEKNIMFVSVWGYLEPPAF